MADTKGLLMPRKAPELSPLAVRNKKAPGFWPVGGVDGLYLNVTETGSRSWILRLTVGSKRREMGLGGFPDVTLEEARKRAREARNQVREGIDPVLERKKLVSALKAAQASELTFEKAAHGYITAHAEGWKNPKHRQQWENTLATYAYPHIGRMLVEDINHTHILAVLEPIWTTKTETATRVRGRIESVLDWATVRGHRKGDNPARWTGHLDQLLPQPSKVAKKEHFAAMPIGEMGAFMVKLRQQKGMAARALEFAVLTAARSGEVRGMCWEEVDMDAGLWIVPKERMKAGKEHRVPLSKQALHLLNTIERMHGSDLVFPAPRAGQLSDMSLTAVMRRMDSKAVPHGFRSTFRDWVAERTNYPGDMAEMALAHKIADAVEAAYRRGDMLEKRRHMMQAWADFCEIVSAPAGEVIPLHKAA